MLTVMQAKIIYVDNDISDGFWINAFFNLHEALKQAEPGDELWVAKGSYVPGREIHDSFLIKDGVKLFGGFIGGEVRRCDRDIIENETILSGDIGIADVLEDNSMHILRSVGVFKEGALIDGFTIRDGYATDGLGGGALLLEENAIVSICNTKFINNHAKNLGGAVKCYHGVHIYQCLFEKNSATMGGAIFVADCQTKKEKINIQKSTFVCNVADIASVLGGHKNIEFILDSCILWNNKSNFGKLNSFSKELLYKNRSTISNIAVDDPVFSNLDDENSIFIYKTLHVNGPFLKNYEFDSNHYKTIPKDLGYRSKKQVFRLNYKFFMLGQF
jgi:predicted outer membrane repeat protein